MTMLNDTRATAPAPRSRALAMVLGLVLAVTLVPVGASVATAAPIKPTISMAPHVTAVLSGEVVYLYGTVRRSSGSPISGVTVDIQRRSIGGSWTTVAARVTSPSGTYNAPSRAGTADYRAVVRASSRTTSKASATKRVYLAKSGSRGMNRRAADLARFIGQQTSATKSYGSLLYASYSRGMLVRAGSEGSYRTWVVTGTMLTTWKKLGGISGKLGRPVQDVRCGLIGWGCIQRFSRGTLYMDGGTKKVTVAYGSGKWTEHAAVAISQVGYKESSWRHNKYNTWVGANNAWCGVFQSWVSAASGNGSAVPRRKSFPELVSAVKAARMTRSTPAAGRLAFFDFAHPTNPGYPTHVGFILEVRAKTVITIEGNSTPGAWVGVRQVVKRERPRAAVSFYAVPYP